MKLNFAFLGLGLAGGVDVHTKSYDPKVHCDVLKNEFRVELPAFKYGEMNMGLDLFTADCGPTETSDAGAVYTYKFDECGTRLIMENGNFVYENHVGRLPLKINGVYRDLGMTYNVRCIIDRHGHVDNRFVNETTGETGGEIVPIYTMPDKVFLEEDWEGRDEYIFRLNVYHTEAFRIKYELQQFPLSMLFKDDVYLGVEVMTAMEHQYIFTTSCWATPTADPLHRAQVYYPIMESGCPSDEFSELEPRLDLEDRFKTQTLKFPNQDYVYIQCDVVVCDMNVPNDPECQSTCRAPIGPRQGQVARTDAESRRRREIDVKPRKIVTVGPLRVHKTEKSEQAAPGASASNIASWILAGGALTALVALVGYQHKKKATAITTDKA